MSNNANDPAYPLQRSEPDGYGGFYYAHDHGLTKREAIAIAAMQGMLSACQAVEGSQSGQEYIARSAVQMADALLEKLNQED